MTDPIICPVEEIQYEQEEIRRDLFESSEGVYQLVGDFAQELGVSPTRMNINKTMMPLSTHRSYDNPATKGRHDFLIISQNCIGTFPSD